MLLACAVVFALALVTPDLGARPAQAQDNSSVSAEQSAAFQSVISGQVAAFQRDDWTGAFGYAAPTIQRMFGDPDRFKRMVLNGYRAVAEPQVFEFQDASVVNGRPAQSVFVIGPDGVAQQAIYFMEQQPDGTWRISGVILRPLDGKTT